MTDKFFVTAIVVSHDGATWIPEVIAALTNQSRSVDRILAVDTGSTDSSVTFLSKAGISVLPVARDIGFGGAIDRALAEYPPISLDPAFAKGNLGVEKEEWLWFIHDDCAPSLDALEKLLEAVEDRPNVAIAGPKLRGWYDRNHLLEIGISIAGNGSRWTGLERREQDQGQHDGINNEVLSVSTAAMLAKRSVFEDIGGFDPNLALFRDDVDLGWRTHVAGFSAICVSEAVCFHAEASASERRAVDVSEAFLHRPLLLDRRNAAYVLLANSSWWTLPWISVQLVISAGIRALYNLLAKLPGYAADELAAVVLLLIKPADLIQARKERKSHRMLSPRVVTRFIPPRSSQFRSTRERIAARFLRGLGRESFAQEGAITQSYSDLDLVDENLEDIESLPFIRPSIWKSIGSHPLFLSLFFITLISTIASRGRFGPLSGGSLPASPTGAMDLIRNYLESWHQVGLGSAVASPPWLLVIGLGSLLTFGSATAFITTLFWLTPPLAMFIAYRAFKRLRVQTRTALVGGVLYALSPVVWAAINQGRLGTIVIVLLAPILISVVPRSVELDGVSWRKIYAVALLAGAISAASALFLLLWTLGCGLFLSTSLWNLKAQSHEGTILTKIDSWLTISVKRRIALMVIPSFLTFPWSASLLLHPTQFLMEPGIPMDSAMRWSLLLMNPGGKSGMPIWLIAPGIVFLLVSLLSESNRNWAIASSIFLALSLVFGSLVIQAHGSVSNVWTGSLLLFAQFCAFIPILRSADKLLPNLRSSHFGLGHITVAIVTAFCVLSSAASVVWIVSLGANSNVRANRASVIPAFVESLAQTDAKPKTLVVRKNGNQIQYFISRGADLILGEPDVSVPPSLEVQAAIRDLLGGTGLTSSKQIGENGIQYLYMEIPLDEVLVRAIDGQGGFTRTSSTKDGIVWKVVGSSPRVLFTDSHGVRKMLVSGDIGAVDKVPAAGTVTLAEKYDSRWRLIHNGISIPLLRSTSGLPLFSVPGPGDITILHDGTTRRALLSVQLLVLLTVVVLALPAGRRRREVPIEEIA